MTSTLPDEDQRYQRWSELLARIRARVDELCAEAAAGTQVLIAQDPRDPQALSTALAALDARIENIRRKMEDTWHEQELDRSIAPGPDGSHRRAPESAYAEWHATERHVREAWATCKVRCMGTFLRAMWPHVDAALRRPIPCVHCGAPLSPSVRHTSESVPCAHCRVVNQCIPEPLVYAWFGNAPGALAVEQVLPQQLEVRRAADDVAYWIDAEYRRTGVRPQEPEASRQHREAQARAYYVALVAAKSAMLSATPAAQEAEVEEAMAAFRQSLGGP
jgi:hypothetical protein